tara:strand:+ start:2010 stop:2429 length:420 start_codon:yes stop_codon:yes gene_type:complete
MSDLSQDLVLQKIAHRILANPRENLKGGGLLDFVMELDDCSRTKAHTYITRARKLIQKDLAEIRDDQEAIIINKTWNIHDEAMANKDFRAAIQALKLLVGVLGLEKKALDISLTTKPTGLEDIDTTVLLRSVGYDEEAS